MTADKLPPCPLCGNLMRLAGHAMDGTPTTVECDTQSCPLDGTQLDIDAARRLAAVDLREENERLREEQTRPYYCTRCDAAEARADRLLAALREIACGGHYGDMRAIAAEAVAGEKGK